MEKTFYPRSGRCPLSQFIFNRVVEVLARVIKEEKKNPYWKGRGKITSM